MAKTIFNPENKDSLTYGECLEPAMKITDPEDAKQYFEAYVEWQSRHMDGASGKHTPEEVCKINIGYFAGYYGDDTRQRVEKLFSCVHPIFGGIQENGPPTTKEIIELGKTGVTNKFPQPK